VQIHQFVAKLHQNAPNRVLNFKKISGVTPRTPYTGGSAPRPLGRGYKGGKGTGGGEEEAEKGEGGGKGKGWREEKG